MRFDLQTHAETPIENAVWVRSHEGSERYAALTEKGTFEVREKGKVVKSYPGPKGQVSWWDYDFKNDRLGYGELPSILTIVANGEPHTHELKVPIWRIQFVENKDLILVNVITPEGAPETAPSPLYAYEAISGRFIGVAMEHKHPFETPYFTDDKAQSLIEFLTRNK